MAESFGVMPWDVHRLTIRHYLAFTARIDARREAARKAQRSG